MSALIGNFNAAPQIKSPTVLSTTNLTTIFTAENNTIFLEACLISNNSASACEIRLHYGNGTDYPCFVDDLAALKTIRADIGIRLQTGNTLKAQAETGSVITLIPIIGQLSTNA